MKNIDKHWGFSLPNLILGKAWIIRGLMVMIAWYSCNLQAQFVDFMDNSSKNSFLGLDMSMCKTETNHSKKNYQKGYDCGNSSVSSLLNLNFLSPELLGQQLYFFNNFTYWLNQNQSLKKIALADAQPDAYFSGSGIFMIVLGTSSYLQQLVAPQKTCPAGQTLLVAQLKYNNGTSIACWSQDSICLAPTDTFAIKVTKDADNTVPAGTPKIAADKQGGVDWMRDSGPTGNYAQAGSSPRKIRLVFKNSGPSDAQPDEQVAQAMQVQSVEKVVKKPTAKKPKSVPQIPVAASADIAIAA